MNKRQRKKEVFMGNKQKQKGIYTAKRMTDGKRVEGYLIGHEPFFYIATHDAVKHMLVDGLDNGKTIVNLTRIMKNSIKQVT